MFLDEKLYQHFISTPIVSVDDYGKMVADLYHICQSHITSSISIEETTYQEGTILIDKAFNGWNLFVDRIRKENLPFAQLLKKDQFKDDWMKEEQLREIYLRGK